MITIQKLSMVAVLWALASGVALADTVELKADLEPSSEVPPRVSHGHGALSATFDTSTRTLKWTATYESLSGPVTTEQQVTDLMGGQWYFNVHTAQNPTGEIRGQVLPAN
jgi:hypothetical protein